MIRNLLANFLGNQITLSHWLKVMYRSPKFLITEKCIFITPYHTVSHLITGNHTFTRRKANSLPTPFNKGRVFFDYCDMICNVLANFLGNQITLSHWLKLMSRSPKFLITEKCIFITPYHTLSQVITHLRGEKQIHYPPLSIRVGILRFLCYDMQWFS